MWNLMSMCWASDRTERPSFDKICEALRTEISKIRYTIQASFFGLDATSSTAREISSSFRTGKATSSPNTSFRPNEFSGHPNTTPIRFFGRVNQLAAASLENPVNVSIHYAPGSKRLKARRNRRGRQGRKKILQDFKLRTSDTSDRSDYLNNKSLQSMALALSSSHLSSSNLRHSSGTSKRASDASDRPGEPKRRGVCSKVCV